MGQPWGEVWVSRGGQLGGRGGSVGGGVGQWGGGVGQPWGEGGQPGGGVSQPGGRGGSAMGGRCGSGPARGGGSGPAAGGGGSAKIEQHREYLLHGGRYASCVHAGGLSCYHHCVTLSHQYLLIVVS